jgi:hypothetical protein
MRVPVLPAARPQISIASSVKPALGSQKFELRQQGDDMSDRAADFTGSIPAFYDHGLGPVFFADFADDISRRAAATAPRRSAYLRLGGQIL